MIIIHGWVILNHQGEIQGWDEHSGGEPWTPSPQRVGSFKIWNDKYRAERYCAIINYGNKGYRVVPFTFTVEDL